MTLHYVTVSIKVYTWISKAAVSTLDSAIYLALQMYLFIYLSLFTYASVHLETFVSVIRSIIGCVAINSLQ